MLGARRDVYYYMCVKLQLVTERWHQWKWSPEVDIYCHIWKRSSQYFICLFVILTLAQYMYVWQTCHNTSEEIAPYSLKTIATLKISSSSFSRVDFHLPSSHVHVRDTAHSGVCTTRLIPMSPCPVYKCHCASHHHIPQRVGFGAGPPW